MHVLIVREQLYYILMSFPLHELLYKGGIAAVVTLRYRGVRESGEKQEQTRYAYNASIDKPGEGKVVLILIRFL